MPMNNSQVRVIDPILSNVVQGYRHVELVGHALFPRVPVQVSGGQVLEFDKKSFQLFNARRAPGANTKRIEFGHLGKPFALFQDALEGKVPFEFLRDASRVPGINLGTRAANGTMRALMLALENEQAGIARAAANYDADHKIDLAAAKWTDDANNPNSDLDTGKTAIADTTGMEPNVLVLSRAAFKAAKNNAKVVERFKYTSKESITAEMLASLFDLERVVVGKAISFDEAGASTSIWGTDAVLAYVPTTPSGQEEPSYGYTYTMEGHPIVEQAYQDRNAKSWIYPVTYERAPVLAGMTAGYLLQNVG
ncbi:major capsid protein [Sedimenticola hydrogenitrophicus]|uniref:major capsid protein n=1 Tax=Sedimenticola hydrogenitrophicus TaxID=2967975 RepID=UPI0023B0B2D3|nr:major capsid protein [Sedimenticola hydrogenitrophicus]